MKAIPYTYRPTITSSVNPKKLYKVNGDINEQPHQAWAASFNTKALGVCLARECSHLGGENTSWQFIPETDAEVALARRLNETLPPVGESRICLANYEKECKRREAKAKAKAEAEEARRKEDEPWLAPLRDTPEEALEESLDHWWRLAYRQEFRNETPSSGGCALCQYFLHNSPTIGCNRCPVGQKTGVSSCRGTPYRQACIEIYSTAKSRYWAHEMFQFLLALYPTEYKSPDGARWNPGTGEPEFDCA